MDVSLAPIITVRFCRSAEIVPAVTTLPNVGDKLIQADLNIFPWTYLPVGAEFLDWGGTIFTVVPVGTTTNFAVYYDAMAYAPALGVSTGNAVLSVCEFIYGQCLTWFGLTEPSSSSLACCLY